MSYIDKSYIKLLIKQREVSKHYKNDCLLNSCLLFMCLLTAPVAVKKHILGQNLLYLSKIGPKYQISTSLERSYKVRQFSALVCYLIALVLGLRNGWGFGNTKNLLKMKLAVVWNKLKAKDLFQKQTFAKYLRLIMFLMWNTAPWEQFNFWFSRVFCYY